MADYAIGDLQGGLRPLQALLKSIRFVSGQDRLWFAGDLVNRGPDSLGCLRLVRSLGASAMTVLGNHDLHLLCVAAGTAQTRTGDTLTDILEAPEKEALLNWLRSQPLLIQGDQHVMVHAGLLPQWTIRDAQECANWVSQALVAPDYRDVLADLYGDQPARWDNSLTGQPRLRLIVNAMTRMRVCDVAGSLDLRFKGAPDELPEGLFAWFDVPGRRSAESIILCGHWSALGLRLRPNLIALDTGSVWGRALTAVRLHDRTVFQVPGERAGLGD